MDEQKKIRVIFTVKADDELYEIIKKYNLEEDLAAVKIDSVSKAFAVEKISEEGMFDYLQKELKLSSQTAKQISKEIITKIVPFLEKAPEEKFEDPTFREEISKKVFGAANEEKFGTDSDLKPKPIINISEINKMSSQIPNMENNPPPPKRIKKLAPKEIEKSTAQIKQSKGPDNYRESIG